MLVVKIDVWPNGDEERAFAVGRMTMANISRLSDLSDYRIGAMEKSNPLTGAPKQSVEWKTRRHNRKQSVYALVGKAAIHAARHFNRRGVRE